MKRRLLITLFLVGAPLNAQSTPPDAAWQTAWIARVREKALAFRDQLQDFICIQTTVRTADNSGTGKRWKPLETQELEVSYVAHREKYKLLRVNGETTKLEKRIKQGYYKPGGEFGTALGWIFNPKANAELAWDHDERSSGRRQCVLRYRVPVATTTMIMQVNERGVPLSHRGYVVADCETGTVSKIHFETDPASVKMHGIDVAIGSVMDVQYGPVTIGGKEFLVPLAAEEIGLFQHLRTKAQIQFQHYRKYDADSTITFGEGEAKSEPAKK